MRKLQLQDLDLRRKKVLMRVDFNVPLNPDGSISDATRIQEALPSIRYVLEQGGSLILMSHLGKPKDGPDPSLSLQPCASLLSTLLKRPVSLAHNCIGPEVERQARALQPGEILLLENLRFHPEEENPSLDPSFARQLASLGDLYVNDAFGTAHRAHASTHTIAQSFPDSSAMGLLMQKEVEAFDALLSQPRRPFYAIVGGAKISSKIGVLKALSTKVDGIFIGGGMAFPFFKAQGIPIGNSLCEPEQVPIALEFLQHFSNNLYLPTDLIIADDFSAKAQRKTIAVSAGIPEGWQGMDIGPETLASWKKILKTGATIFWNGPVGVFELAPFAKGTKELATTLAHLSAFTVVGGGDSVSAINHLNLASHFSHVSTGGGASLELLEHGHLPGIDILTTINF